LHTSYKPRLPEQLIGFSTTDSFIKLGRKLQADFKPTVVWLILNGKPEEALTLLAKNYKVTTPKLKVGLPKGRKATAFGVYTSKNETIHVLNSDVLMNPFVILHEFYHHLRSRAVDKQHRGTEKNADKFASEFLKAYYTSAALGN
jgi:hypothetical protein